MDQVLDIPAAPYKLHSQRAIFVSTFLAGPLAGTFLISENFKSLGESNKAGGTLVVGTILTLALFLGIFLLPENIYVPNFLFPIIFAAIANFVSSKFQGKRLAEHAAAGGSYYSGWRAFGFSMLSLVITVAVALLMILAYDLFTFS